MRPLARTITIAAAMAAFAAGTAVANAQTPKAPAAKSAAVGSRRAGSRRSTSLVAKGTISSFDHSTNTLTIKTAKGEEQFALPTSARIQEASRRLSINDLDTLNGRTVSVRYRQSGGQRTVQSVRVAGGGRKATKS